ncbi:DNA primase [Candidatus Uhrbacteria bacterium]|nr:DNA primase [Candidatus Uhrbacteria bacterium]
MAMDSADQVKAALDVADVVAEYLTLKPAGSGSFRACCPFHQEKTPSFYVNRPRQTWHCFGCNEGGDLISFVQRMEGLDFPEALQLLADKAGVKLPQFDARASSDKKRLHEVNDLAARFFHAQLLQAVVAAHAREYVKKRGLDDLTIDIWRLGYAPESWDALANALKAKDVTEDEMIRAGLVQKSDRGGVYDRFRNRLMFPIADVHGNIVGFTGRILADDKKEAKYVNTPETAVYKKSNVLYGLDKAKGHIKRQDMAVIVEGNMDVIGSHQFNFQNVVCSSGTALTIEQLGLLKRFTANLAIAFDADSAGNAATIRGLDLARGLDFNLRIISLPPEAGKDPDDAVRKDPGLWKQAIADALPVIDWLYRNSFRGHDASKPEGKKEIAKSLLAEFKHIADPVERDAWLNRLAKDLDVSTDSLREAMRGAANRDVGARHALPRATPASPLPQTATPAKTRLDETRERYWAILFLKPELEALAKSILDEYYQPVPSQDDLLNYIAVLADREFQDQSLETLRRELEQASRSLRDMRNTERRSQLEHQMREAERTGDQNRINDLLAQFNALKDNP